MPARTTRKTCSSSTARRWPTASSNSWMRSIRATRRPPPLSQNRVMARRHRAALYAGSLGSCAALLSPLSQVADGRLSVHMLEEMLMLAVIIPLLAYGISPLRSGRAPSWLHPVVGMLALNVVLFGSQLPAVVDLASRNVAFREAAQVVFLMGAFLFWWPVVRRDGL
ncbi:MAG: cytochrome c oxidase assembly protein, partial [Chloroflexi bacterium]